MLKPLTTASFSVFGFDIRYYGVMLFLGMGAGILFSYFAAQKSDSKVDSDILLDFFPWLIIVSVFCARLYYVLLNLNYYAAFKSEIFAFRHGGISIHGAILGGLIFSVLYFKFIVKKPLLPYADIVSCGLALGQAVGRWGNFFNQEAFGTPCDLPWKLFVEPRFRPSEYADFEYFHPTFLYESIFDLLLFFVLYFIIRKIAKGRDGIVFCVYLILYSAGRFFIEGIRTDSALNILNVPIAQIVSVLIFFAALVALVFLCVKYSKLNAETREL